MNRNVLTAEQIKSALDAGCLWADSLDFENVQCRTLIHWNSLTSLIPGFGGHTIHSDEKFGDGSAPIHQTCALRTRAGAVIYEPPQA